MKILMIGDIVGTPGCEYLRRVLPRLREEYAPAVVIANGENSADRNGITAASAEHIFTSGVDVITTGNHVFRQRNVYPLLESCETLLRPANYPAMVPGKGVCVLDKGYARIRVINLMGVVYMQPLACPFTRADELLADGSDATITLVDFHAEATAEKKALAYHLGGRVSAVVGTHTHVMTADEAILPGGTGFITDMGMTGPMHSVLGVKPECSIRMMKDKMPTTLELAPGPCTLQGVLLTVDRRTGRCENIRRICVPGET